MDGYVYNDEELINCRTISSSIVAKFMSKEVPQGTPERMEFGKKFEESYQDICYRFQMITDYITHFNSIKISNGAEMICSDCKEIIEDEMFAYCNHCGKKWHHDCDIPLSYNYPDQGGVYVLCDDCKGGYLVKKFRKIFDNDEAVEILKGFILNKVIGLIPRTVFRKWKDDIYIACKPDLEREDDTFEFKTYPINEYAINQCKVFGWVLKKPIILAGWNGKEAELQTIEVEEFEFPEIPDELFTTSQIAKDRMVSYDKYTHFYEGLFLMDDEYDEEFEKEFEDLQKDDDEHKSS